MADRHLTVDANVAGFERRREELRRGGRTCRAWVRLRGRRIDVDIRDVEASSDGPCLVRALALIDGSSRSGTSLGILRNAHQGDRKSRGHPALAKLGIELQRSPQPPGAIPDRGRWAPSARWRYEASMVRIQFSTRCSSGVEHERPVKSRPDVEIVDVLGVARRR